MTSYILLRSTVAFRIIEAVKLVVALAKGEYTDMLFHGYHFNNSQCQYS